MPTGALLAACSHFRSFICSCYLPGSLRTRPRSTVIPLKLIDQAAGPDRSLPFMSWRVGVIVFPMMWSYFQIKRLSKCALKRVACPTLVLCGRQDALTPVALYEEIAARSSAGAAHPWPGRHRRRPAHGLIRL